MPSLIIWHNRFYENENEVVRYIYHDLGITKPKSHDIEIPRPKIRNIQKGRQLTHDIKIPGPKNCNIEKPKQLTHDIVIPRHFFRGQKATTSRFQYLKTSTSRFQDLKATNQVSVEFWPLYYLILCAVRHSE